MIQADKIDANGMNRRSKSNGESGMDLPLRILGGGERTFFGPVKIAVTILAATITLTCIKSRADVEWTGPTDIYTNPADWSTGVVPGPADNADNSNGSNNVVQIAAGTPNWTVFNLSAGEQPNSSGAIEQNGPTLTISGDLWLAEGTNSFGTFTLDSGELSAPTGSVNIAFGPGSSGVMNINSGLAAVGQVNLCQDSTASAVLNLNDGTLQTEEISGATNAMMSALNINGGTLEAAGNNTNFLTGLSQATIGPSGAVINSLNYTVTIDQSFSDAGGGALTKLGKGTLILAGTNSYAGPTYIQAGTLIVSNLADGGTPSALGASSASPTNLVIGGTNNSGSATFEYSGPTASINRGCTFSYNATLNIEGNLTFSGLAQQQPEASASSPLTKTGPATLTFAGVGLNRFSSYFNGWELNQGTVILDGSSGNQLSAVSGQLWVGAVPNYPANLILTNTVLISLDWFAIGRGTGASNCLSTTSIYNSEFYVSTDPVLQSESGISLGYNNGLQNLASQVLNLYGNSTLTNDGNLFLIAESGGSTAIVNVTNTAAIASTNSIVVVGSAGCGTLNLNSTGTSYLATGTPIPFAGGTGGIYIGGGPVPTDTTRGAGAINQSSGTLVCGKNGSSFVTLGYLGFGSYNLSGGTLIGSSSNGLDILDGSFNQSGGQFVCRGPIVLSNGVANFTGGSASLTLTNCPVSNGYSTGIETFNLGTEAGGSAIFTDLYASNGINFLKTSAGQAHGTFNLNSGTFQIGGALQSFAARGSAAVNLNGGTLQAGLNKVNLMDTTSTSANVFNGGLIVDTMTNTATISANLLATTGNGIYPQGGTFLVSSNGGSGYIGAPLVTISGGSGSGAMAIATVSGGAVTNIVMTCPGQNYQAGDVLTFAFQGGALASATANFISASNFIYTLQAADIAPNGSGGVTKIGTGTLLLTGTSTYLGPTIVNAGTLAGTGDVAGGITVAPGATLGAGSPVAIGALTVGGAVSFLPGSTNLMKFNGIVDTNDVLTGMSQVTYDGTLVFSNVATTLKASESFKLYNALSYNGAFAAIIPASPGPGLAWNTNLLAINGTLSITNTVNLNPTNLILNVSAGRLSLSWPQDHLGWELEAQTDSLAVGLTTNWVVWPGSSNVTSESIPITSNNPAVFFRLISP